MTTHISSMKVRQWTNFAVFLGPALVLLALFFILPVFVDIAVAFTDMGPTLKVTGFTTEKIPPTNKSTLFAVIVAVTSGIRLTIGSGETPTSTLGLPLSAGSKVEVHGSGALNDFRCIDDGGTATVEVVYMGRGGPTP